MTKDEALEKKAENARELGLDYEPEPVAWGVFEGNLHDMFFTEAEAVEMAQLKGIHAEVRPLYTAPQRTWVGMTDDEREQVINANTSTGLWHMAKDIEAKLKDKNT
jgi:hypothetical protein